jgi:hypothetical protein
VDILYNVNSPEEREEHKRNNGYTRYTEKLLLEIDWGKLAGIIESK